MLLLMITLLVFAAVAAAAFMDACVPGEEGEEVPSAGVDYRKLHAHWAVQGQARDLNAAVFRFAVPGEPLTFNAVHPGREARPCPAQRRARVARWPL